MTLLRVDPAGTDGGDVTTSSPVTVVKAGAGTLKFSDDYGFDRGSRMGIEAIATGTADQSNLYITNTAGLWGMCQGYFLFPQWPTGGSSEFLGMRVGGAGANAARFFISTAGSCTVQNRAGTNVATIGTLSLDTIYRFELDVYPGSSTSNGELYARVYSNADVLVAAETHLTGQNLGGDVSGSVTLCRAGDASTATVANVRMGFTQIGFDTSSSRTTIPPVDIEVPPDPVTTSGLNRLSWQTLAGVPGWY